VTSNKEKFHAPVVAIAGGSFEPKPLIEDIRFL
jgi:hypothetical protein